MYGILLHWNMRAQSGPRTECNKYHVSWVHVMLLFYVLWAQLPWVRLEDNRRRQAYLTQTGPVKPLFKSVLERWSNLRSNRDQIYMAMIGTTIIRWC